MEHNEGSGKADTDGTGPALEQLQLGRASICPNFGAKSQLGAVPTMVQVWKFPQTVENVPTPRSYRRRRMLISWSMVETLTHAGYEVTEAGNANETLQRSDAEPRARCHSA
jgi:hypothetical protein